MLEWTWWIIKTVLLCNACCFMIVYQHIDELEKNLKNGNIVVNKITCWVLYPCFYITKRFKDN